LGKKSWWTNPDIGNGICTDADGNVFITGYFEAPTITFDSLILTSAGNIDVFTVKYDTNGNAVWAKSMGGASGDYSSGITADISGNVIITGYFLSSTITFGSSILTNAGAADIFVAKYDNLGNELWAKSAGGVSDQVPSDISTDVGGNLFISGSFMGSTIAFGNFILTNANSNSHEDIFIAKYDASGNVLWAKSAGGSSDEACSGICTDANSNVLITGFFDSPTIVFGGFTLISAGHSETFITKYDSLGNVLWTRNADTSLYEDIGRSISTDANGNVFVTGHFSGPTITFDNVTLNNTVNSGYQDIFVVKYDASGNILGGKSTGGTDNDDSFDIATDLNGNAFITGGFSSPTITFGITSLTNSSANQYDFFIAKSNCITTGFEVLNNSQYIKIYPNPFSTQTVLRTGETLKDATLYIYNSFGQQVKQIKNISEQEIVLQRENLPSGLYFIHLMQDSKTIATNKLIIVD